MSRNKRAEQANETMAVLDSGHYTAPSGAVVSVAPALGTCLEETRLLASLELERILKVAEAERPSSAVDAIIEVVNETTLEGIAHLHREGAEPIAALNFASAKNPGGGFLGGSQAQEESLARSSGLHASLMKAWPYYEQNRENPSLLYSDSAILSPGCPVFRDDNGVFLETLQKANFISCAAPNAGAIASNSPGEVALIPEVFLRRSRYVLAVAATQGYRNLVLGAWGCGVFRNDPHMVAETFARLLFAERWAARFARIRFSVLDASPDKSIFNAFGRLGLGA
jgi:uncharacterized protein (TIGR02452 family)